MASIGTLHGTLTLKSSEYERHMKRCEMLTASFRKAVFGMGAQLASVQVLWRSFSSAIQDASALTDMATATRTSIEGLQGLLSVSRDAGAGMENLRQALIKINTNTELAAGGQQEMARQFRALNIDISSFLALGTEQKLEALGRAYLSAANRGQAYLAVNRILGEDAGPKLIEVLERLGVRGLDVVNEKARQGGEVLSELAAVRLDRLSDRLLSFATRGKVVLQELTAAGAQFIDVISGAELSKLEARMAAARAQATREIGGASAQAGHWQSTQVQQRIAERTREIIRLENEAAAAGGPVSGGHTYLVGERGPELFTAPVTGAIIPNHQLAAVSAGGGATYIIDARGADREGLMRLESAIVALNGSIEHRAVNAVFDAQRRKRI